MYPCVDKVRQFNGQRDNGLVVPNAYPCGLVWDFAYDPTFAREAKELFVTTERFTKLDQSGLKALFEPFFQTHRHRCRRSCARLAETIETLIGVLPKRS